MPYHLSDDSLTVLGENGKPVPNGRHKSRRQALAHLQTLEKAAGAAPLDLTKFRFFIPLTKVDAAKRQVWGYAAVEEPDQSLRQPEIMDWASSRPNFEKWSNMAKARSNGASLGNVREQHDPHRAAGMLIAFEPQDEAKGLWVGAEIVDDQSWRKVEKGVLTGFSVGGTYGRRWPDGRGMRYTAEPDEISIVDAPCIASATFQMIKATGAETRPFAPGSGEVIPLEVESMDLSKTLPTPPPALPDEVAGMKIEKVAQPVTPVSLEPAAPPEGDTLAQASHKALPLAGEAQTLAGQPGPMEKTAKSVRKVQKAMAKRMVLAKADQRTANRLALQAVELRPQLLKEGVDISEELLTKARVTLAGLADQARALKKEDPTNLVGSVTALISSLKEQAAAGEVDAGLLQNVAQALGTMAEMVVNMAPEAEQAAESAAGPLEMAVEPPAVPGAGAPDENGAALAPAKATEPAAKEAVMKAIKNDGPLSTTPPQGGLTDFMSPGASVEAILPQFTQALARGDLRKARDITGHDKMYFDEAFNAAARRIMGEINLNMKNHRALAASGGWNGEGGDVLAKAIAAGDMPGVNLLPLVRLMLPVYSGMGTRIPITTPKNGSNQATWRTLIGYGATSVSDTMSVAEASTGTAMAQSFLTYQAAYRDLTGNSGANLKAIAAARGYDDPLQVATVDLLAFLLGVRERNLLYSNSGSIAAPASLTLTSASTGGALTCGSTAAYGVYVTAQTGRGWNNHHSGSAATGETTPVSASGSIAGTGTAGVYNLAWPYVPGAVAYNVYISASGGSATGVRWVANTGATAYQITAYPGTNTGSYPSSNLTANAYGYSGLWDWASLADVYGNTTPATKTVIDAAGAAIVAGGGGITVLNQVFQALWNNWQISPSILVMSPKTKQAITAALLTLGNNSLYKIELEQERGRYVGGASVGAVINPFASDDPNGANNAIVPIQGNPYMPDGNIMCLSESVPYALSRTARAFEAEQLIPWTYFPLAQSTLSYPFAVTESEVLECFHPSAQAAIVGLNIP